jgi:hypothetical protein
MEKKEINFLVDNTKSFKEQIEKIEKTNNNIIVSFNNSNLESNVFLENLSNVFLYEEELFKDKTIKNEEKNLISLDLKNLSREIKIDAFKKALSNENLIDSNFILNIYNFIKMYNSFEDSFFECKEVFLNSLEEYLDVKEAIVEELENFCKNLSIYYLGIVTSNSYISYNQTQKVVNLPQIYSSIFYISNFFTLSKILNNVKNLNVKVEELPIVNNAYNIMFFLSQNYVLVNNVFDNIKKENENETH